MAISDNVVYYYVYGNKIAVEFDEKVNFMNVNELRDITIKKTHDLSLASDLIFTECGTIAKSRFDSSYDITHIKEMDTSEYVEISRSYFDINYYSRKYVKMAKNTVEWYKNKVENNV